MNGLEEIKRRLKRVIDNEIALTERERAEFEAKKRSEEEYWGFGGNYCRFEKCEEKRVHHLEELEALAETLSSGAVVKEQLRLYPWYCPSCQMTVYLDDRRCRFTGSGSEIIDCPICQRTLYRAGNHTTWDVIKGSRYTSVGSTRHEREMPYEN